VSCEIPEEDDLRWEDARVTVGDESLREVSSPRMACVTSLFTPKKFARIGCWNVRTMYALGKTAIVAKEMKRYHLDVLGISEVRWTGFGEVRVTTGESFLYSGSEEQHHRGVGLMLSPEARKCLIKWNPVSERIISARFNSKHVKVTIIQIYSPTNDAEEEEKDEFYEQLQKEIDITPKHDMLIFMGDANGKVGCDNQNHRRTLGKEGLGTMNENGERLVDLCEEYDLVIGGTLFKHKEIHKYTWVSPNNRDKNQIDHFIINGRYRRSLADVRAMRGADAGTDHNLVVGKVKLRLSRHKARNSCNRTAYNTARLKQKEIHKQFTLELKNRFEALEEETQIDGSEDNTHRDWEAFSTAYNEAAVKVLGKKEREHKEWISAETWKTIDERKKIKNEKNSAHSERIREIKQQQYSEMDREVKRKVRADKREKINELAQEAEDAANNNDMGTLYKITKELCHKKRLTTAGVRDKNGKLLIEEDGILQRWKEHFEEVLNVGSQDDGNDTEDVIDPRNIEIIEEISTGPFTEEEVKNALSKLKNGKAAGVDNISGEMLKAGGEITSRKLLQIFENVRKDFNMPEDWKKSMIAKIPKKGDLTKCDNSRGISLLSIPGKVFCRVIMERIREGVEQKLRNEQAAYRRGRGTAEQIFILRNIVEQSIEWQAPLYINFIDFRKAFDSINRKKLWKILRAYGIPDIYVNIMQEMYEGSSSCVINNGQTSDWFPVKTGVRQGCVMSGFLFIIAVDWVMRKTTSARKTGIRWKFTTQLEDLDYADDIALLSSKHQHLQEKTERLCSHAESIGLQINTDKTKVLRYNNKETKSIEIKGKSIVNVDTFTYLGAIVNKTGGSTEDIKHRLGLARRVFAMLGPLWKSSKYSKRTKIRIFNSNVMSVLLYGAEMWKLNASDVTRLETFQRKCLRRILRIFWPMQVSNQELYHKSKADPVGETIKCRRWRWIGHTLRKAQSDNCKVALTWAPEGKRKRGRPRTTWRRSAEAERKELGWQSWSEAAGIAKDRTRWRKMLLGLMSRPWLEEDK
jgi:hypothetical protein